MSMCRKLSEVKGARGGSRVWHKATRHLPMAALADAVALPLAQVNNEAGNGTSHQEKSEGEARTKNMCHTVTRHLLFQKGTVY